MRTIGSVFPLVMQQLLRNNGRGLICRHSKQFRNKRIADSTNLITGSKLRNWILNWYFLTYLSWVEKVQVHCIAALVRSGYNVETETIKALFKLNVPNSALIVHFIPCTLNFICHNRKCFNFLCQIATGFLIVYSFKTDSEYIWYMLQSMQSC